MKDNLVCDNVNLSVIKSQDASLVASMNDKYILEKYKFGFEGITIKKTEDFLKHLKNTLKNVNFFNFDFGFGKSQIFIESIEGKKPHDKLNKCLIYISVFSQECYVEVFSDSIEGTEFLYGIAKTFIDADTEPKIRMLNYYLDNGRMNYKEKSIVKKDLGYTSSKFYPDFEDIDECFKQFTISSENIMILSGKSGIGKTKFTRLYLLFLLSHMDLLKKDFSSDEDDEEDGIFLNVAYIKNEEILSLDAFWLNLQEYNYDLVILDDLDSFLAPRTGTVSNEKGYMKDKFVSNMLSFTDGLIPTRTKFLITTNRPLETIDKALTRDGRLFDVFEFRLLNNQEALEIWLDHKLEETDFNDLFKDKKEILQAELGKHIHSFLLNNKKKNKKFLKEDSKASISGLYKKDRKVGF